MKAFFKVSRYFYPTLTFLSCLLTVAYSNAFDITVEDYHIKKDVGLFFTRPEIAEHVVYYVPKTEQTLKYTGISTVIEGEDYNIYEATVRFPAAIDLNVIRQEKPVWGEHGFLRSEVNAIDTCRVKIGKTEDFHYFQQIDDVWKRSGLVSTTEAVFCKVTIAIRIDDVDTLAAMEAMAETADLIFQGIDSFNLIIEDGIDLTQPFNILFEKNLGNFLTEVSRDTALLSIGIALSENETSEIKAIIDILEPYFDTSNDLISRFFTLENNAYTLRQTIVNPFIPINISFDV